MLTIVLVVTGIGLLNEMIQAFSPDRLPSALDLLADFLGILIVTLFMFRKLTYYQPDRSLAKKVRADEQDAALRKTEPSQHAK